MADELLVNRGKPPNEERELEQPDFEYDLRKRAVKALWRREVGAG